MSGGGLTFCLFGGVTFDTVTLQEGVDCRGTFTLHGVDCW